MELKLTVFDREHFFAKYGEDLIPILKRLADK